MLSTDYNLKKLALQRLRKSHSSSSSTPDQVIIKPEKSSQKNKFLRHILPSVPSIVLISVKKPIISRL
jgi:hypothetical protein